MLTHADLKAKALNKVDVRAEYELINRQEFAILDEMLAARHAAGLSKVEVAERWAQKPPL